MHMGNYLGRPAVLIAVMAASSRDTFGIRHTTVVPTNYDPETNGTNGTNEDDASGE